MFKLNARETWHAILVSFADIYPTESLCILAERLSQSEIVLPLRKTCYYSPLAEVGVSTQTEMKSENFSTIAGCGKILRVCCYTIFRFKQSKSIFSKLYFLLS